MAHRSIVLTLAIVGGCAESPPDGLHLVSYHVLHEVYRIAEIPDGYAILGRHGLVGYDHDDSVRWDRDPTGAPLALAYVDAAELLAATKINDTVQFDRVGLDGSIVSSWTLTDPMGPLEIPAVAIRPDAGAWVYGGSWPLFWQGQVAPDRSASLSWSTDEKRDDLLMVDDTEAYALRVTWSDEMAVYEHLQLQRLAPDGSPTWTSTVYERSPDDTGPLELGGALAPDGRGGVYVISESLQPDGGHPMVRRFDPAGALRWSRLETEDPMTSPRMIPRPGGGVVWVSVIDGRDVRIRLVDDEGEVTEEATFDGDGTGIFDAIFIEDVLHVLSNDGLTRISVPR